MRHVIAMTLVLMLAADVATAVKKKPTMTPAPAPTAPAPAPAPTARPESLASAPGTPAPVARTPGPLIRPGSPIEDRSTIAPFPIPGDTSRAARDVSKLMNVPRAGVTAVGPLPGATPEEGSGQPLKLSEPQPVYPEAARDAGIEGTVVVMAQVLADGTVGETHLLKSIPALDDAAVQAVKRMRFRPTFFHGRPFPDWVGVPVRFTLH